MGSSAQVIVVDDDSDDCTAEVAEHFGVTYHRVTNHNTSLTRNDGLSRVVTPYVAFLDDDDAWLPVNMTEQISALESDPNAAFAFGITQCATNELEPLPWTFPAPPLWSGLDPNRLHLGYPQLGVVLFRTEVVLAAGGFDPGIPYHQDADLMLRIAARHAIIGVNCVGALYRLRPPSRHRADYLWAFRDTVNWRPKNVGLRWVTHGRFMAGRRRHYFHQFLEDADACARAGMRRDTLWCLSRAARISPPHALRHAPRVASTLCGTLMARGAKQ